MGRAVVWVILGLAIAGVAVFALTGGGGGDGDGELPLGDAGLLPEGDTQAPELIGSGRGAPAGTTAGPGKYTVNGTVLDGEGKPQGGVPVIAYDAGKPWRQGNPWNWAEDQVQKSLARLEEPERELPIAGRTESAEDGSFTLRLAKPAKYEVHARPAAPRIGTYNDVHLHEDQLEQETTLRVLAGAPLRGRILDADDRPIAGVVRASWWKNIANEGRRWRSGPLLATAPDATFELPAVPEGEVRLGVVLEDQRSLGGFVVESPHEGVYVIRIPGGNSGIRGTVADAQKQGIAGATVLISVHREKEGERPASSSELKALTAADGSYQIAGVPPGELTWVRALAKGFITLNQHKNQAPWAGAKVEQGKTLDLDLAMQRGGTVRGRVLVLDKNVPIAGATVRLLRSQTPGMSASGVGKLTATTGADGAYLIKGVATGRYVALAEHEEHFIPELDNPATVNYSPNMGARTAPPAITVVVTGDDSDIERDLFLKPGAPVRGRVEDGAGKGVAGAAVHARNFGLSRVAWQWGIGGMGNEPLATSEADGAFETAALPPREDWVLYAKKKGLVGTFSDPVALAVGTKAPAVKLRMQSGGTIRGKLICEDQSLVASAQVGVWGSNSELAADSTFKKVKADGTFELTGIPPGTWTLNVWMNGRQGVQKKIDNLKPGEVREGIELELSSGVRVAGILVDKDGNGVANTQIYLQASGMMVNGRTDKDGRFVFEGVKEGRCQIMTWASGRSRSLGSPFQAPKEDVRIVFEKEETVVISGEVQDPAGNPVALCYVKISAASKPDRGTSPVYYGEDGGVEAVNGKFRKQVAGKGPYKVAVTNPRDEQGRPLNLMGKTEKVVDPTQPVIIKLEGGLEIRGRVADGAGKPVAGVTISCNRIQVPTDASGEYAIAGLKKGRFSVSAQVKGPWIKPKSVNAEAGSKNVDFVLEKGMKIRGKAIGPDGEPLAQGHASGNWPAVGSYSAGNVGASLGPKGDFTLDGIPPSAIVRVQVQTWNYGGSEVGMAPRVIEGVRPGTDDLEVRLGAGVAIEGTVRDANGKAATMCYVHAQAVEGGGGSQGWVQVGADGAWKLAGLEAKRYKVQVHRQDGGAAPKPVEVDAPATGVRIVLPKTTTLGGRVEGLGEKPGKWRVTAWHADGSRAGRATVNADGSFHIETVADGGALIVGAQLTGDSRYALKEGVQPGSDAVVLRLKEGLTIAGVVDGAGAGTVYVRAKGTFWQGLVAANKDTGRFEIPGLVPGRYALTAWTQDNTARATKKDVEAGTANLRIALEAR